MKNIILGLITFLSVVTASASQKYLHYTCAAYSQTTKEVLLRQFHLTQALDQTVFQLRYNVLAAGQDPKAQESLRDFQFRAKAQSASLKSLNASIHKDGTVGRWLNYDQSTHEIKQVSTPSNGYIQVKKINKSLDGVAVLPGFNSNQQVLLKCSAEKISSEGGETCALFFCL